MQISGADADAMAATAIRTSPSSGWGVTPPQGTRKTKELSFLIIRIDFKASRRYSMAGTPGGLILGPMDQVSRGSGGEGSGGEGNEQNNPKTAEGHADAGADVDSMAAAAMRR